MTVQTANEVTEFLAAVEQRLSDLPADDRQELLDGLAADLNDLVAERGPGALGNPDEYAEELRTAAGLDAASPVAARQPLSVRWSGWLDRWQQRALRWLDRLPGDGRGFFAALRPAWWVGRAWLAVAIVAGMTGDRTVGVIPWADRAPLGVVILAIATWVSVQIGRGLWWPGARAKVGQRTVLAGLNVFAVLVAVPMVAHNTVDYRWSGTDSSYSDPADAGPTIVAPEGLWVDGRPIHNIFPYDATGNALVGVQLRDQDGRPIAVTSEYDDKLTGERQRVGGWFNGSTEYWSVFPLAVFVIDPDTKDLISRGLPTPPYASVGGVTMQGVVPSAMSPDNPGKKTQRRRLSEEDSVKTTQ